MNWQLNPTIESKLDMQKRWLGAFRPFRAPNLMPQAFHTPLGGFHEDDIRYCYSLAQPGFARL